MARKNKKNVVENNSIILASSITPIQLDVNALPDGTYRNTQCDAGKCTRCNRGIMNNAVFIKHGGQVYGPECVTFVRQVEQLINNPEEVIRVVQHQFRLRMRDLTTAGMKKKGLIKVTSPTSISLSKSEIEELVSMG
jgi:hypothetical protein